MRKFFLVLSLTVFCNTPLNTVFAFNNDRIRYTEAQLK